VHPAKNNIKNWGGGSVYVWAGFLSADVTFVKSKNVM
jgi:hypothetical protein